MEARPLQVGLDLAVGVAPLELRVEDDVGEDAATEAVAEAHERAHLGRLDALQGAPEPGLEGDVLVRLEQERIEREHAELAIAGPGLALAQALERADVHEDRLRPAPLHVVGRGVLEDEALVERREEQVELEESSVPQHSERPLVRVGDDRDALVAKDGGHACGVELGGQPVRLRYPLGGDQPPGGDAVPKELGGGERLPVGEPALGERAAHLAADVEDVAVRVAERASLDPGHGVRYESSFFRTPMKPRNRRQ